MRDKPSVGVSEMDGMQPVILPLSFWHPAAPNARTRMASVDLWTCNEIQSQLQSNIKLLDVSCESATVQMTHRGT